MINAGLLLFFSFLPGANFMYMGLMKRGLAVMGGFFLLIYLAITAFAFPLRLLFVLASPIYWAASFFNGFHVRKKINSGEYVKDGVSDVLDTVFRNRRLTLAIFVVLGIALLGNILGIAVEIVRAALPMAIILLILYVIFSRGRK